MLQTRTKPKVSKKQESRSSESLLAARAFTEWWHCTMSTSQGLAWQDQSQQYPRQTLHGLGWSSSHLTSLSSCPLSEPGCLAFPSILRADIPPIISFGGTVKQSWLLLFVPSMLAWSKWLVNRRSEACSAMFDNICYLCLRRPFPLSKWLMLFS